MIFAVLAAMLYADAQSMYNVRLGRDNVPLTQVKLQYNGSIITQTAGHSVSTQTALPVDLLEVTINDGGTIKTLDQLNLYGSAIRNNNFASNVGGVGVYDRGTTTAANNAVAFENAMGEVASGPNLLAYLYYDGTSNLPSGDDFDMFWSYGLDNDDYIVVAERNGNTYFTVTPLDSAGNAITSARRLRFGQTNGTNSSNGNRKYDWNIGYRPTNQNQPMYMTVVDVSLFNSSVSIHGIRIDNNGQADVKFFGVSDDPFTDNRVTTVVGSIVGNVLRDANGNINNYVDGQGIHNPSSTQLYVSAVNSGGAIQSTVSVDTDGTYELLEIPNGTYTVKLHTNPAGSTTSMMPGGWYFTGENLGGGSGHDGTVDGGLFNVQVNDSVVRYANFGIFTNPLAVSWQHLQADERKGMGIEVAWSTASEENSYYFEIERSTNGTDFVAVGEVAAIGNSQKTTDYSYLDTEAALFTNKKIIYRIRQVDMDLSYQYSDLIAVTRNNDIELSVYPNPTSGVSVVRHDLQEEEVLQMQVVDAAGRVVHALENNGDGTARFDGRSLKPGVYYIRLTARGRNVIKRVLVEQN